MEYRLLGKTGLPVSALSYGSWATFGTRMDTYKSMECIRTAYEKGVNFFDNAEVYTHGESEYIMGDVFKKLGFTRDTWIVSSKAFFGRMENSVPTQRGLHRKHLVEACHDALNRLQIDYLDLYFCHRPDPTVPLEVVVETMSNLVRQGKILYWGTSEWSAREIQSAHDIALKSHAVPPQFEQPQYNLVPPETCRNRIFPLV